MCEKLGLVIFSLEIQNVEVIQDKKHNNGTLYAYN